MLVVLFINLYFIVASILSVRVWEGLCMLIDLLLLLTDYVCVCVGGGSVYVYWSFIVAHRLCVCVWGGSVYVKWSFIVTHILSVCVWYVLFMLIDLLLLLTF